MSVRIYIKNYTRENSAKTNVMVKHNRKEIYKRDGTGNVTTSKNDTSKREGSIE